MTRRKIVKPLSKTHPELANEADGWDLSPSPNEIIRRRRISIQVLKFSIGNPIIQVICLK